MKVVVDIDEKYYNILKYEVNICHNEYKPIVLLAEGKPIEMLTDTEHRIFLTAMYKEKAVCKEVCEDGSGIGLVSVCYQIIRKVKKICQ